MQRRPWTTLPVSNLPPLRRLERRGRPATREIVEPRELAAEAKVYAADRAVALLADDDLGHALVAAVGVVDLVAVDEQDHVRILFDRARLAQVGHHRAL